MTGAGLWGLETAELGRQAIFLQEVDSTNRYLKEHGSTLPHGAVCFTDRQTGGRGRLGRSWTAPDGTSLAMSVLLRETETSDWSGLPLVFGMAAADALNHLVGGQADHPFQIKWPNDIICSGYKICGILCESTQSETGRFAVAGIGVNLTQTAEDFRREGLPYAGSVWLQTGQTLSLEETAVAILNHLERLWTIYNREGFTPLRRQYEEQCVTVGREIRLLSPDGDNIATGRAAGVAADGGLIVDTPTGRRTYHSGEVSVRGLYGYI